MATLTRILFKKDWKIILRDHLQIGHQFCKR